MGRPKKECAKCAVLSDLEMERLDLSYKHRETQGVEAEPVVEPPKRRVDDDRDKLMFNAGRFAGGARDKVAVEAHRLLQIVMGNE